MNVYCIDDQRREPRWCGTMDQVIDEIVDGDWIKPHVVVFLFEVPAHKDAIVAYMNGELPATREGLGPQGLDGHKALRYWTTGPRGGLKEITREQWLAL